MEDAGGETQGGKQGSPGNDQAWDRHGRILRYTGAHRLHRSYTQRHQDRGTKKIPVLRTPNTSPDLLSPSPGEVGRPRCQLAGLTLPAPQGWGTLPAPSGICLPSPSPCPKATYLLPGNRVADGTWGAQVAGAGQCCELSHCWGNRGSCPPGGQKSEPPRGCREQARARGEATPPRAATGTPWHHRTEPAQAGGQEPQGASRHQLQQLRQTCRLQAALGYKACVFFNHMPFFPSQSAWRPWGNVLKSTSTVKTSGVCFPVSSPRTACPLVPV